MHRLLERQIRKRFAASLPEDARFASFLVDIDTAYAANDSDRTLLERSIELLQGKLDEIGRRRARRAS